MEKIQFRFIFHFVPRLRLPALIPDFRTLREVPEVNRELSHHSCQSKGGIKKSPAYSGFCHFVILFCVC